MGKIRDSSGRFVSNRITRVCLFCINTFCVKPSQIKKGGGKYCSRKCVGLGRRKKIKVICETCLSEIEVNLCDRSRRFCNRRCRAEHQKMFVIGDRVGTWKGGRRLSSNGYVLVSSRNHPYSANSGYMLEHRLVMEKKLGRYLLPEEVVHHINKVIDDNRIENLTLFESVGEHTKHHRRLEKIGGE